MTSTTLFYIIIAILIINFIVDKVLDALNAKHFNDALPEDLQDVYDETEYKKSQNYQTFLQEKRHRNSVSFVIYVL